MWNFATFIIWLLFFRTGSYIAITILVHITYLYLMLFMSSKALLTPVSSWLRYDANALLFENPSYGLNPHTVLMT